MDYTSSNSLNSNELTVPISLDNPNVKGAGRASGDTVVHARGLSILYHWEIGPKHLSLDGQRVINDHGQSYIHIVAPIQAVYTYSILQYLGRPLACRNRRGRQGGPF